MLIQLRQSEIEEALKMYVTQQGFSLVNKTVDVSFTSGRKDNGVSADLDINDKECPNLTVIQSGPLNRGYDPQVQTMEMVTVAEDASNQEESEELGAPVTEVPVKSAASLFG